DASEGRPHNPPMSPQPRKILLGVTGGIAAYKSPDLVRRLMEHGAEVQVVMSRGAQQFVTALTFQAVSGRPVRTDLFDAAAEAAMGHIELARWADEIIVAPAIAEFIARFAHGFADDLLATICLATTARITLEPAQIADEVFTTRGGAGALHGLKVVVTAGPTREAIDPVRFISNRSSGKMGYAVAQ